MLDTELMTGFSLARHTCISISTSRGTCSFAENLRSWHTKLLSQARRAVYIYIYKIASHPGAGIALGNPVSKCLEHLFGFCR